VFLWVEIFNHSCGLFWIRRKVLCPVPATWEVRGWLYCSWHAAGSWPCPLVRTWWCRNWRPSVAISSHQLEVATLALQLRHHHVHTRGQGQEPAAYKEQHNFLSNLRRDGTKHFSPYPKYVAAMFTMCSSLSTMCTTHLKRHCSKCITWQHTIGPT